MQALACGYYLIYLSVLVGLWLLWFVVGRERWSDLLRVVVTLAVSAALLSPILYGYWKFQRAYGLRRWPDEIAAFSADVASLLKASDNLRSRHGRRATCGSRRPATRTPTTGRSPSSRSSAHRPTTPGACSSDTGLVARNSDVTAGFEGAGTASRGTTAPMLRCLSVLSTVLLAGCLSSNVLLTVREDGSGTIEEVMTVRTAAMADAARLVPGMGPVPRLDPRKPGGPAAQMDAWRTFGDVRVVSDTATSAPGTIGRRTLYAFDDIHGVEMGMLPGIPSGLLAVPAGAKTAMRFALSPNPDGTRLLKIQLPRFPMDPSVEPPAEWATGPVDEMAQLRDVIKGTRVTLAVRTEPEIVRTNSPLHEGDRVVLLDFDAEQALFNNNIDALRATPATFDELLTMVADLPGVKVAREHDLTIEFGVPQAPQAATQPSNDPDIFLTTISRRNGALVLGPPINITNSPGYDNQPSFTRDGRGVLFSSVRGAAAPQAALAGGRAAAPPTDIYRYDIDAKSVQRVTNTPEAEYSPTVMPDGLHISVVRVEADGTQRLWKFGLDGSNPSLVLTDIKPVGYHAWIDANTLALFVLGQPATLQIADVRTGQAEIVAQGIGRSVLRTPSGAISFVRQQRAAPDVPPTYTIEQVAVASAPGAARTPTILVQPVPGSGDPNLAWMPDGTLLMAHDGTLYSWRQGQRDWTRAADLAALGLSGVTRLAVSPRGDRIAIVAVPR